MRAVATRLADLKLVFHDNLSDSYELSNVLLATADFDGTLQLLTSGWERLLGYGRGELMGRTLADLLWSDRRSAASAATAILERPDMGWVDLRVRCRNGAGKCLRLHRRYDTQEQMIYIVAEELPARPAAAARPRAERRAAARA